MLTRIALGAVVASVVLVSACSSTSSSGAKPISTNDADASMSTDAGIPSYGPIDTTTSGLATNVDPFIGTGDATSSAPVANGLNGGTFPGATTPFGMVQFSPDTPNQGPPGYHFVDTTITGFSLTHLNGAGCGALRDLPIFPNVGRPDFTKEWSDTFAHTAEVASPGFYEVKLGSGISVDLTATQRTGLGRFTFPEGSDAYVTLTGGHKADTTLYEFTGFSAHISGNDTVTGERDGGHFCLTDSKYRVFYALKFDRPFENFGVADKTGNATDGARDTSDTTAQAYFRFDTTTSRIVHVKVGLSYVSSDAAMANMNAENPNWDFDAVHAQTLASWNGRLGKVQVEGTDDNAKKALYTGLYHTLVQPAVNSDVDGTYMGFDNQTHNDPVHPRYSNFSGWDVYRSWVHLAAILAPQETSDFVRSLM
ncbi:MAG: glycoside hydrolase domain-containing protein, partial [Polyangiaceae bacterium]